ncbi:MAG: OmpA family protein [Epsilonproteobacteria bacterium]|nr:MAG: OmpA family protein [Campylobacterota bacterium]
MHIKKTILVATLATFIFGGCSNQPGLVQDESYDRTKTGAAAGALAGAIIGYNSGSHNAGSALLGAAIGGLVGGGIGYSMDEQANEIARALGTGVNNDPLAALDPNNEIIVSKNSNYVKIMFRDRMMFASNSATLQSRAKTKVKKVGILLANYSQTVVGVAGFTDNDGGFEYNQKLSKKRADTVGNLLAVNGRPFTKGCSYDKAIVANTSAKNKALNRRVEVYLYSNQNNMSDPCR